MYRARWNLVMKWKAEFSNLSLMLCYIEILKEALFWIGLCLIKYSKSKCNVDKTSG